MHFMKANLETMLLEAMSVHSLISQDKNVSSSTSNPSSPHRRVLSLVNTGKALLQRRVKSNTVTEGIISTAASNQSDLKIHSSSPGHRISKSMDSRQLLENINGKQASDEDHPVVSRLSQSVPKTTEPFELLRDRNNSDPGLAMVRYCVFSNLQILVRLEG